MLKRHFLKIGLFSVASLLAVPNAIAKSNDTKVEEASIKMPIEAFAIEAAIKSVRLSDNGKKIGYMKATSKRGDYILEVRPTDNITKKPVTFAADKMEMTGFFWLSDEKIMVNFRQNIQDGNENYWVIKRAIVSADGTGKWKVPFAKENFTNYSIISTLRADPEHILLSYDINKDRKTDVIKYNINNGSTRTVYRGNEMVSGGFLTDFDGDVRAGTGYDISASAINLYVRAKGSDEWELIHQNKPENREVFDFLDLSAENPNEIIVSATMDQNTAGIYTYNIETKKYSERLFGLATVDTDDIITSQKLANYGELLGYSYTAKHPTRFFLSDTEAAVREASLYQAIEDQFKGEFVRLSSRSDDDNAIVIYTESDSNPGTYYLLMNKKDLSLIGDTAPLIDKSKLAKVMYVKYKARDGLVIPAYVTIPQGKGPFPTIVHPHGGPWSRDVNIFDPWSQLLANNGYLVIQPQFRGSQGFGLELWKAGDGE